MRPKTLTAVISPIITAETFRQYYPLTVNRPKWLFSAITAFFGAPASNGSLMKYQHFFLISTKNQSFVNLSSSEYQSFVNIIKQHQNISNMSMKNKRMLLFYQSEKHQFKKKSCILQNTVIFDEALMYQNNKKSIFWQHNLNIEWIFG